MNNSQLAELLEDALKRIENESRWTTGWFAKDAFGFTCEAVDEVACRWCALGTLQRSVSALPDGRDEAFWEALKLLDAASVSRRVVHDNDRIGHNAVMATFKRAIAGLRQTSAVADEGAS